MGKNTTKKVALYAALYRDRGETVKDLPEQLLAIRDLFDRGGGADHAKDMSGPIADARQRIKVRGR